MRKARLIMLSGGFWAWFWFVGFLLLLIVIVSQHHV